MSNIFEHERRHLASYWPSLSLVPFKGPKKSRAPQKVSILCQGEHLESLKWPHLVIFMGWFHNVLPHLQHRDINSYNPIVPDYVQYFGKNEWQYLVFPALFNTYILWWGGGRDRYWLLFKQYPTMHKVYDKVLYVLWRCSFKYILFIVRVLLWRQ